MLTYCQMERRKEDLNTIRSILRPSRDTERLATANALSLLIEQRRDIDESFMSLSQLNEPEILLEACTMRRVRRALLLRLPEGETGSTMLPILLRAGQGTRWDTTEPPTPEVIQRTLLAATRGEVDVLESLLERYAFDRAVLQGSECLDAIYAGIAECIRNGATDRAGRLAKQLSGGGELTRLPLGFQVLARNFSCDTIAELLHCKAIPFELLSFVQRTPDTPPQFTQQTTALAATLRIHACEAEELLRAGIDLSALAHAASPQPLALALRNHSTTWKDDANVWGPFSRAIAWLGEAQGYEIMFEYLKRDRLKRHDGLHFFDRVIALGRASGYQPLAFAKNVILGVARDNAEYESGEVLNRFRFTHHAHEELDRVTRELPLNLAGTIREVHEGLSNQPELAPLLQRYRSPQQVCASWPDLLKFRDLVRRLTDKQWSTFEPTITGPGSTYLRQLLAGRRVSSVYARELWEDPKRFWERLDRNDLWQLHDTIKPSTLCEQDHIRLDPRDLRSALLEGWLDEHQTLPPLRVTYTRLKDSEQPHSLREWVVRAVGAPREGRSGIARDPEKLRRSIDAVFMKHGTSFQDFLRAGTEPAPKCLESVTALLLDATMGIPSTHLERTHACLHAKSDPMAIVLNEQIPHCMRLGSGKLNVYQLLPTAALFSLAVEQGEGGVSALANSVVTINYAAERNQRLLHRVAHRRKIPVESALSEDILRDAPRTMVFDNAEIAANAKSSTSTRAWIGAIYQDFAAQYLARFGTALHLRHDMAGLGHDNEQGEVLPNARRWKNRTLPSAVLGYSDATKGKARMLPTVTEPILGGYVLREISTGSDVSGRTPLRGASGQRIRQLVPEDVYPVSYIENIAYANAHHLRHGAAALQSSIVAMTYSNRIYQLPALSFVATTPDGSMEGYLIAYQGIAGRSIPIGCDLQPNDAIVYVEDVASLSPNSRAGSRLLRAFAEKYQQAYLRSGSPLPILADLRGPTTNRHCELFRSLLNQRAAPFGYTFSFTELERTQHETESHHTVVFTPTSIQAKTL